MSETEVNIPLLRKAVEWAEAEAAKPRALREWEQSLYVLPASDDDPVGADYWSESYPASQQREVLGKAPECGTCYCIAGFVASVSGKAFTYGTADLIASEELGLPPYSNLFAASNSIADVRRIAESIAGERL